MYYVVAKIGLQMLRKFKLVTVLAAILAWLLFGAQLHCCLDLHSQSIDSHFCPVCSTAGNAIVTVLPTVELAPSLNRLEIFGPVLTAPPVVFRSIAPRAPPSSVSL